MPTKQSYIDSDSDSNLPISLRNKILLEKQKITIRKRERKKFKYTSYRWLK